MNASDYLDAQLAATPNAGMSASDYLDTHALPVQQSGLGALETYANAPFSGLVNAASDTALGSSQAMGGLLNGIGILPDNLPIGGVDYGYKAGNEGINQLKKIKDEEISSSLEGNTPAKVMETGGNLAGNVALFSLLGGNKAASSTGMQGLLAKIPSIGPGIASLAPAVDAGAMSSYLQPAQNENERNVNSLVGGGVAGAGKLLANALSTQVMDPTKQAALQTADQFNIPVYRTQVSDNNIARALASFEKDIPLSGAGAKISDQVGAFNNAVNGTIGQTGNAVTPETLAAADKQIGSVYDAMTGKYDLPVNNNFLQKLQNIQDAAPTLGDQNKEYALQSQINAIRSKVLNAASGQPSGGQGVIQGPTYQGLRSRIGGILRGQNGSPELGQLQDLLDSHFQAQMTPSDAGAFQTARNQYRNMLSIEKVVANSPNEAISPAKLQGAVKNVFGNYAYGGGSDLERLARLGNVLKDTFPNSGTATRNQLYELAKHAAGPAIGIGVGAGEGYHEGGTGGALLGAGAGLAMNRVVLNPYLYSQMSSNPAIAQSLAPGIASALIKQQQGGN